MQRSRKSSKRSRNPRNRRARPGRDCLSPPEFVPTLSLGHRFRFTNASSALTAQSITRGMLMNLVSMATTTTNQFRIISAMKLKRVQMWGAPPILGNASNAIAIEWVGTQAPSTIHSDSTQGVRPAFVDTRPPSDSSDRWWSLSGQNESEVLFKITGPIGSVVDISGSVRLVDDEAAVAAESGTGATSTVGTVYFNYLDGFASKKLAPVGGVTVLP